MGTSKTNNTKAIIEGVKGYIDGIMSLGTFVSDNQDLMDKNEFIERIKGIQSSGEQFLTYNSDEKLVSESLEYLYSKLYDACNARIFMVNNIKGNDRGNSEFENALQKRYKSLIEKYIKATGEDDEFKRLFESVKLQYENDMKELESMENEAAREVVQLHGYGKIYDCLSKVYQGYLSILKRRQQSSGEHPGAGAPLEI